MGTKKLVGSIVRSILARAGYSISSNRVEPFNFPESSMEAGLDRVRRLNISPTKVIDIGAAAGTWTEKAIVQWPEAKYELIEPLSERQHGLSKLKSLYPNINYHNAVAGEHKGEIGFNVSEDLDGSGVYNAEASNSRKLPIMTVDDLISVKDNDIVIKFDTHGYEIPILKGASNALKQTALIIMEVYGFRVSPTCLLFHEMSEYLLTNNFRLIDLVDIMRRPGDNAFWQCDAFFLKKDHPIFQKNSYA